jgi:hypothetical protein
MMSTMFVVMKAGVSVDDLHQHLVHRYHVSSFALSCMMCFVVHVLIFEQWGLTLKIIELFT